MKEIVDTFKFMDVQFGNFKYNVFVSNTGFVAIEVIMHRNPDILHIHDSSLELYGLTIEYESVQAIWIRGYFRPILGLKQRGKKTLLLEQWADHHGIPFKTKFFTGWF